MNGWALPSILWPVFRRNSVFCGHRMDRCARSFILWPGGQGWRSFLPAGPRKTSFFCPVVSRRGREQPLKFCLWLLVARGAGKGLGWGYLPSSSRSSGGGSCCCPRITPQDLPAPTVPKENPLLCEFRVGENSLYLSTESTYFAGLGCFCYE